MLGRERVSAFADRAIRGRAGLQRVEQRHPRRTERARRGGAEGASLLGHYPNEVRVSRATAATAPRAFEVVLSSFPRPTPKTNNPAVGVGAFIGPATIPESMQRLHARYPFLDASREAVEAAEVDLAALVVEGGPAVDRGRERVQRALLEGTTEAEEPRAWSDRAELLSYPVARVLVSLLDVPGAVEKYAAAEAATARERFVEDFEADLELKSAGGERLTLDRLLADFGLSGRIEPTGDGEFSVAVTAYLELAAALSGERWRLVGRPLDSGRVPVSRPELYTLLREAVGRRVEEGLPLSVPEAIGDPLDSELSAIRRSVADLDPPTAFDAVVPGLFPPCMRALLTRAREGEALSDRSRFSLVAFLVSAGLDRDEVVELCAVSGEAAESIRQQVDRLREEGGEGSVAAPPSCAVMDDYGDCVDKDELCESIEHPLSYYEQRLESAPGEQLADWRAQ
jgi:DNA primase large subunit